MQQKWNQKVSSNQWGTWADCCFCSVNKSCLTLGDPMDWTRLLCPPLSPRGCSNSCPLSQWCYLAISFSFALFWASVFSCNRDKNYLFKTGFSNHMREFKWKYLLHFPVYNRCSVNIDLNHVVVVFVHRETTNWLYHHMYEQVFSFKAKWTKM